MMAAFAIHVLSVSFVVPRGYWCSPASLPMTSISLRMSFEGMDAQQAVDTGSSTQDFVGGGTKNTNKWNTERRGVVVNSRIANAASRPTAGYMAEAPDKVDAGSPTAAFLAKSERELFLSKKPPEKATPSAAPETESDSPTVIVGGGRDAFFKVKKSPATAPAAPEPESDSPSVVVGGGRDAFFKAARAPPAPTKSVPPSAPPPPPPAAKESSNPVPPAAAPLAAAPPASAPPPAPPALQRFAATGIHGMDARSTVDSSSSTASFALNAEPSKAPLQSPKGDRVLREAPRGVSVPAAAAPLYSSPPQRKSIAGMDANWAVDSSSTTASFAFNPESAQGPQHMNAEKWARAQEKAVKSKLQAAVLSGAKAASDMALPNETTARVIEPTDAPSEALPTPMAERIAALEFALLGDNASPQGPAPFQRMAWLETQLGQTSGTMVQRLDALEAAAKAQGLL